MDYREIYAHHAEAYHELVSAEDCDASLKAALSQHLRLDGAHVADVGAGTGRISRLLLEGGARVTAIEPSAAMRAVAQRELSAYGPARLTVTAGDARELPLGDASVDAAIAGWVFGHFRYWEESQWEAHVDLALGELFRTVKPGGRVLIAETLGTAMRVPAPPNPKLAEYYDRLQSAGFVRQTLATDYLFSSVEDAARVLGFFFGAEIQCRVMKNGWARVPEWTGLWVQRRPR